MISLHYTSDRVTRFRCANTIIYIQGIPGSFGYRSLEIIYYIKDIQAIYIFVRMTYLQALDIKYQYKLDLKDFNQGLNQV